jgi:hypothetical protein
LRGNDPVAIWIKYWKQTTCSQNITIKRLSESRLRQMP